MTRIIDILEELGYKDYTQLKLIAKLVYLTGGIDGKIKSQTFWKDEFADLILQFPKSIFELNQDFQINYFHKFRGANKERHEISNHHELQDEGIVDFVINAFHYLGFKSRIDPGKQRYDIALVFGANQCTMDHRIAFLNELIEKGYDFEHKYILAGKRLLWLDKESSAAKILQQKINQNGFDITEKEVFQERADVFLRYQYLSLLDIRAKVAEHFIEKYSIDWPTETDIARFIVDEKYPNLRDIQIVDANGGESFQIGLNGGIQKWHDRPIKRPDTLDTIIAFKQHHSHKYPPHQQFNAVAISNQPYIKSQEVTTKLLPENINCQTIGRELLAQIKAEELLAEFAVMLNKRVGQIIPLN